MKVEIQAPAKINWFLSVEGKRGDGYHDIISPMQCVSLFDRISLEESGRIELHADLDLPAEENLVYRAAALLKKSCSFPGGVKIHLVKEIPVAAGLGGGSSDAAATLMGLNRLWKLNMTCGDLMRIGAEIGSDVPFFIGSPFSLAEGRGEKITPLSTESSVVMLLVKPPISVSSAWAYSAYKTELTKKRVDIKLFCQSLDGKDFRSLRNMIFNDLEKAVVERYHIVAEIKEMLMDNGAVVASMSGSGPTVFGIFHSNEAATRAAGSAGKNWCRVVRTLSRHEARETITQE